MNSEITNIKLTPLHVPFKEQVRKFMGEGKGGLGMAIAAEEAWLGGDIVICQLETKDGFVGVGEAFVWLPESGVSPEQIIDAIKNCLAKYVLGKSPFNIEKINHRMDINLALNENAKGLLDMACYDLMGKLTNNPVYNLIGGKFVDEIPLSALIPLGSPMLMKGLVRALYKDGYRSFRLKIGKNIQNDVEILKTIRNTFGNEIRIRVDYNQAYNPFMAVRAIKAIEPYGIDYAEQPVNSSDYLGMAHVQKRVDTPLMAHEGFFSLKDFITLVELGAVGVLGIISGRPGGITKTLRAMNYARMRGLGIVLHDQPLGIASAMHIHLNTAFYNSIDYPTELFGHQMMEDDLLVDPLNYERGKVKVPDGPGWGVELNQKALEKYATQPTIVLEK